MTVSGASRVSGHFGHAPTGRGVTIFIFATILALAYSGSADEHRFARPGYCDLLASGCCEVDPVASLAGLDGLGIASTTRLNAKSPATGVRALLRQCQCFEQTTVSLGLACQRSRR